MGSEKAQPGATSAAERRDSTRRQVQKLLKERQQMFALFGRLVEKAPFIEGPPSPALIEDFCEVLIDYIASGHFGIYRRIAEGRERRRSVVHLAADLYPGISATTEAAVEFNDAHATPHPVTDVEKFTRDLSSLGELLDKRVDMEDRLMEAMLSQR